MRALTWFLALHLLAIGSFAAGAAGWILTGSDELDAPDGTGPDPANWTVEWDPGRIVSFGDGRPCGTLTPADLPPGRSRVIDDRACLLILDVAVTGHGPGSPDVATTFPQSGRGDHVGACRGE